MAKRNARRTGNRSLPHGGGHPPAAPGNAPRPDGVTPPAARIEPDITVGVTSGPPDEDRSPEVRLQEALWHDHVQGDPPDKCAAIIEIIRTLPRPDPVRTGVGAPDAHAEAAGAGLGGDTGDVGTPRDELGGTPGGTHGTHATSEASTVQPHPSDPECMRKRRHHAA